MNTLGLKDLCMALSFAVIVQGDINRTADANKVRKFAGLIEAFCNDNNPKGGIFAEATNEHGAAALDHAINKLVVALKRNGKVQLPKNQTTLSQYYVRLQIRKLIRIGSLFTFVASPDKLARAVISYLEEEVEEMRSQS